MPVGISPIVQEGAKAAIRDAFPCKAAARPAVAAEGRSVVPDAVAAVKDTIDEQLQSTHHAQLVLYARTQYGFYAVFQTLVVVLSIAAVFALVVGIVRLTTGSPDTADAVVSAAVGVGALVSGAAAMFIQRQASDAKDRYLEALRLLEE
jgi:hypothetical protein